MKCGCTVVATFFEVPADTGLLGIWEDVRYHPELTGRAQRNSPAHAIWCCAWARIGST